MRLFRLDLQTSRIPSSLSSFSWPAASLNPAKLCLAIHAMSVTLGLELYTHTPVYSVAATSPSSSDWNVITSRGTIRTPKVVHATNAYAGALSSEVKDFVTPVRGSWRRPRPRQLSSPLTHTTRLTVLFSSSPRS